ncbi:MAG TPA: rod shape-determining protein MreC [Marmoricola sp.]|nr:rod shape-determining protein MreC [Marmoricola sp.]
MAPHDPGNQPSKSVLALLLLACLTVLTLDARGGASSPVEPLRTAVGTVVGPVESGTAAAIRPFQHLADYFGSNDRLRRQVASLTAENSRLRSRVEAQPLDRNRLAELEGLTRTARHTGYALVAARVVAMGPSQSFSRTVTIDAGTSSGVHADMTVLNNDGLVGRVLRATPTTATVLLITDEGSVVGGRLGSDMELGFLHGRGSTDQLDLDLLDSTATPSRGDVVVTWGSQNGAPYVAGIPIGKVVSVWSTPREMAKHAVIDPFVDFSALDVVGVVVPRGTHGDRRLITSGGD